MARLDVIMPQMGESIAEGTLSRWMKKVGEPVKRDEPIFEISTDKVDAEIPAPAAGVLVEIKVQEGQTVPVQTVVAVIDTEAGATVAAPIAAPVPAAPVRAAPPAPSPVAAPAPGPVSAAVLPPSPSAAPRAETVDDRLRSRSTPLVRRIAAENHVDFTAIPGSGVAGRVTKKDLLGYIEAGGAAASP